MKKLVVIGFLAGVALGASCIRTLAPTVEDKDLIADATLAGEWVNREDPQQFLRIEPPGADKHYKLRFTGEKGKSGSFDAKLGRVGELIVAEVRPEELPEVWSDEYKGHFAPLYSFYVVYDLKPALKIGGLEADWLGPYLKAHPAELAVSPVDDGLIVSPPEAVRAFLLKHWKDPGALTQAVFVRREVEKSD
jgi:hypothetical protein